MCFRTQIQYKWPYLWRVAQNVSEIFDDHTQVWNVPEEARGHWPRVDGIGCHVPASFHFQAPGKLFDEQQIGQLSRSIDSPVLKSSKASLFKMESV